MLNVKLDIFFVIRTMSMPNNILENIPVSMELMKMAASWKQHWQLCSIVRAEQGMESALVIEFAMPFCRLSNSKQALPFCSQCLVCWKTSTQRAFKQTKLLVIWTKETEVSYRLALPLKVSITTGSQHEAKESDSNFDHNVFPRRYVHHKVYRHQLISTPLHKGRFKPL